MNKQVYGFALGGTRKLLYRLKNIDCCYLVFPNNLDMYLDMLIHDQPEYVLGLGSYSGTDQDKVRVETICTNKFRNDLVEGDKYKQIEIELFIKPAEDMKYARGIGNSYCNLVSWKITQLIKQKKLKAQYAFLHIPKTIKPWVASPEIDKILLSFRKAY